MKKCILVLTALLLTVLSCNPGYVYGYDEYDNNCETEPKSIGLINEYFVECSVGTKKVHIRMNTKSLYILDEIGFKNIYIQRSSDLVNWYTEKTISSLITTNQSQYYLSDYTASVNGGYYYRVNLDHYAKDGSTTEYQNDISYSVWIS